MTRPTETVRQLAQTFVADLSPVDLPVLAVSGPEFFSRSPARRRMAAAVARRSASQIPAAFGSVEGPGVVATVLVILNGIAGGTFRAGDERRQGWLAGLLLARRLGATAAADAPLPVRPVDERRGIIAAAGIVAARAGLTDEQVGRLVRLLESAMTPGH